MTQVRSFTTRTGLTRFAFINRNGTAESGRQTYRVRIRDHELSTKPVQAFECEGHDQLKAALRRRGCRL